MDMFLLILAVLTFIAACLSALELSLGNRRINFLRYTGVLDKLHGKVSIVVAARNEQRHLRRALESLMAQDFCPLEVIVVNDRSTDDTAAIGNNHARSHDRLTVVHITELPGGWLGKNHALYVGAQHASGDYLLFTDADVIMHPTAVSRAISFVQQNNLDHLAVTPQADQKGTLLNILVGTFLYLFTLGKKPWKARDRKSRFYMGIGAFNLIAADAYKKIGTHQRIAMRPDDDMMLGLLVKKNHLRQDVLNGIGMINIEWYTSLGEMIRGLEKNAFAGLGYSVLFAVFACLCLFTFLVFPLPAVFLTTGAARILNLLALAVWAVSYADNARFWKIPLWHGIALPLGTVLLIYAIANAVARTIRNRGINWRGTHYPLEDLKANRI
jgi:glycosyltransferase involved in cell wall biosynthesis